MNKKNILTLLVFIAFISGCAQTVVGEMKFPEGVVQHVVHANNISWKPCPPSVPSGCEMVILEGHPKNSDLFTVRFRLSEKFFVPAHTHPKDERVTILKGKLSIAFGKNAKREDAKQYGLGDYYVNARNEIHTVWVDDPAIIQITGIGPWVLTFVDKNH